MSNDAKNNIKSAPVNPTGRQMVRELARQTGASFNTPSSTPGVMCQQGQDWSRGTACLPQTFVRLVGYRDPDSRPSSPLPRRHMVPQKKPVSNDTPIG